MSVQNLAVQIEVVSVCDTAVDQLTEPVGYCRLLVVHTCRCVGVMLGNSGKLRSHSQD